MSNALSQIGQIDFSLPTAEQGTVLGEIEKMPQ
jgi:hypothetical protein